MTPTAARAARARKVRASAWAETCRKAPRAARDVARAASHAKVFRHPLYPRLAMTSTSFAVQAAPGTRMVVYVPADDATRTAMEQMVAAGPPQPRFPCWPAHQARALVPQPALLPPPVPRKPRCVTNSAIRLRSDERDYTMNHPVNTGCDLKLHSGIPVKHC